MMNNIYNNEVNKQYKLDEIRIKEWEPNPNIFEIINKDEPIIAFKTNGDIFIKGKLVENDKDIVEGFREFLRQQGLVY